MIPQFAILNGEERELLFKAPVLVSVLACSTFGQVNEVKKKDAIRLAHLRGFTAPPLLRPYYQEVEKRFTDQFEEAVKKYEPFNEVKRAELKNEIGMIYMTIEKLEPSFGKALLKSLEGYARHVKHSLHSVFQDFIFPVGYSKLY